MEIEVKPRILVPDTNCFIDYLASLKKIAKDQMGAEPVYYLNVPLIGKFAILILYNTLRFQLLFLNTIIISIGSSNIV